MPQDRLADSYEIYSELLPGDQIEWGNVPRSFWMIQDATIALPLKSPCESGEIGMLNPHFAVHAPRLRQSEFAEVLADFDVRCHDRYLLDASQFHLSLPVRMLDLAAQRRYTSQVSRFLPHKDSIMQAPPTPDEFKGAAGMHSFSAVYFNKAHTLAMTHIGMYCGGLCGNWRWVVLERKEGLWTVLPWETSMTVS